MEAKPLIVIVGPTASGKSALAVELAKKYGGEIICADSRTVYDGMDIGTAKPTIDQRAVVPHWGLDLVIPTQRFTAADFKRYAEEKIRDIRERGHVPFLVGGTGLYVDGIIFDYQFGSPADAELRQQLSSLNLDELYEHCKRNNIKLPNNERNKRYVIRAIEQKTINKRRRENPINNTHIVGITLDREELRTRIEQRIEQLFIDGVVEEATMLSKKYGWETESMTGNIYPIIHDYVDNRITLDATKHKAVTQDWRLAKRQLTWLRRNKFIKWCTLPDAKNYLLSILASEH